MKMIKIYRFFFFLLFCSIHLCANSQITDKVKISGEIQNFEEIGVYTILATHANDSIRGTFYDSSFSLPVDSAGSYRIKIIAKGFSTFIADISIQDKSYNLGALTLEPLLNIELQEVVVKSDQCVIKNTGEGHQITNIRGSYLGDAGSIKDMLEWTPGLMSSSWGNIQLVNGKTPIIYIDGRQVANIQLQVLRSEDVAKIEVIREPGARYSTGTQAVVNITLRKKLKDYLGVNVSNALNIGRKISDDADVNLMGKLGKLSSQIAFHYELSNALAYRDLFSSITASSTPLKDIYTNSYGRHLNGYYTFAGLNYAITDKSYTSLQYFGSFTQSDRWSDYNHNLQKGNEAASYSQNTIFPKDKNNAHTITAGYYNTLSKTSSLDVTMSYSTKDNKQKEETVISLLSGNPIIEPYTLHNTSNSNYNLLNFEGNYTFQIGKNFMGAGLSFDYIHNSSKYASKFISNRNTEDLQRTSRKDFVQGAYFSYRRQIIPNLTLKAELRYEYNYTSLKRSGENTNLKFNDFLPFLNLHYQYKKSWWVLAMRRATTRPTISELNSIVSYTDLYHCIMGNPTLKPYITNRFWLAYGIENFETAFYYARRNNKIVTATYLEPELNMICSEPINSDHQQALELNASYSYSKPKFSIRLDASGYYTTLKYSSDTKYNPSKITNWSGSVTLTGNYKVASNFELYGKARYFGPYLDGNMKSGNVWGLNAGVKGKFLKKRLIATLELNDILRKSVTPSWTRIFDGVEENCRNFFDTRKVKIQFQYIINVVPTKYRRKDIGRSANSRAQ